MPLVSRTFDQLIDFTRTSAATYVDASGRIVPTPASRNLLTFTQEFDNAAWVKGAATVTANATTAPDGTITADKVVATAASGDHAVYEASPSLTNATTYTYSFYVKASGYSLVRLAEGGNGFFYASFDLANQTVVSGTTGGGQFVSAAIVSAGDGWFRCSVVFTSSGGQVYPALIGYPAGAALNGFGAQYTGDGTSGVFLWGAQLEAGSTLTNYTRNNGGVYPPRFDYDPATLAPKGLLIEEARTNLFLYSEDLAGATWDKNWGGGVSVTSNQANGPDGAQNLDLVTSSGLDGAAYQSFATAFNAAHSVSFFVRQGTAASSRLEIFNAVSGPTASVTFSWTGGVPSTSSTGGTPTNIKFENYGGGLYRVSFSFVSGGSGANLVLFAPDSTSGLGTSYAGYFQLEAGAFATSYIPTVASQVTRTADVATITGANFSQWYNQSEGSLVVEGSVYAFPAASSNNAIAALSDGTTANSHYVYTFGSAGYAATQVSSVVQANPTSGSALSVNTPYKMAYGYKTNDFAFTVNGATVGTDASGTVPAVDQLQIGRVGSTILLNGWIRSIRFFPTRLSNAQLQALTA